MTCGYCGRTFVEDRGQPACDACPLGSSCGHILCPYCGFENPATPKWISFLKDKFGRASKDPAGTVDGPGESPLGDLPVGSRPGTPNARPNALPVLGALDTDGGPTR